MPKWSSRRKQRGESVQVFRRLFRLVLSRRDDLRIVTILRLELLGREVVQLAM
jgi:hypothetical protein